MIKHQSQVETIKLLEFWERKIALAMNYKIIIPKKFTNLLILQQQMDPTNWWCLSFSSLVIQKSKKKEWSFSPFVIHKQQQSDITTATLAKWNKTKLAKIYNQKAASLQL